MTPKPLTTRQKQVLGSIKKLWAKKGICPTFRELSEELGVTHGGSVMLVKALERKGYIKRDFYKSRSMKLVGECCPKCGRPL